MKYMIDEPQQYHHTLAGGALPTLYPLYYDEQLLSEAPILEIGANSIQHARNRSISPYYMEYALEISTIFNQVIKGEINPELAVYELQKKWNPYNLKIKLHQDKLKGRLTNQCSS